MTLLLRGHGNASCTLVVAGPDTAWLPVRSRSRWDVTRRESRPKSRARPAGAALALFSLSQPPQRARLRTRGGGESQCPAGADRGAETCRAGLRRPPCKGTPIERLRSVQRSVNQPLGLSAGSAPTFSADPATSSVFF